MFYIQVSAFTFSFYDHRDLLNVFYISLLCTRETETSEVIHPSDPKGQLILKGLFGFFDPPKKQTKNLCPSRLGQKLTFSSSFFGRIEDAKITFRD